MLRKITSGDSTNLEAQAAHYWPQIMGKNFRRDRAAHDANGLLNYGHCSESCHRSRCCSRWIASIGLHHSNRNNAFTLADDLMEPFRPLVDCSVHGLVKRNGSQVDTEAKTILAGLIALDLPLDESQSPISVALTKLATSLGKSFEKGELSLALPQPRMLSPF